MKINLLLGDCVARMAEMPEGSVGSIVCDPPYGLRFMNKEFDDLGDGAAQREWHRPWLTEALRVLRPGGVLKAFGGTRTFHHLAATMRSVGFICVGLESWSYGSGFPKSLNIGKGIDKRGGVSVSWFGPWLRKWREEHGITQHQVASLFPSKSGNRTGCVANWELGFNLPTVEQFNLLCRTYGFPFASIQEAEREVVGRSSGGIAGGTGEHAGLPNSYGFAATFDRTAPATDAARAWEGWGTALKPAWEPVVVGVKP
ncbi:MAG: hypothetical protein EBT79_11020 [Actinobacteria bacterium]|nr:hypothetical protein [Actinomycetota bacterium]NBR67782.1 hypothetical protein [Actinomycetota bacterium]